MGILAAFFGVLISVGFWLLEIRNEELVNCGRHALDQIEKLTMLTIRKDDEERNYLDKSLGPVSKVIKKILGRKLFRGLLRHRVWLRLIFAFIGIAFVGAVIRGPMGSSLSILLDRIHILLQEAKYPFSTQAKSFANLPFHSLNRKSSLNSQLHGK